MDEKMLLVEKYHLIHENNAWYSDRENSHKRFIEVCNRISEDRDGFLTSCQQIMEMLSNEIFGLKRILWAYFLK